MTGEELAKLCFAARPVLWALAIIAILFVASILVPKIFGFDSGDQPSSKSLGPGLPL
jgi:hypothetical protein